MNKKNTPFSRIFVLFLVSTLWVSCRTVNEPVATNSPVPVTTTSFTPSDGDSRINSDCGRDPFPLSILISNGFAGTFTYRNIRSHFDIHPWLFY
ncbi:MAG: hypothetical protein V9G20_02600 [Candidatus Promineifilaceae bacterium]